MRTTPVTRFEPRHHPEPVTRSTVTEAAQDPCDRCGSRRVRVTEDHPAPSLTRPASMGEQGPHVTIRCAGCFQVIDEFDA